ncbi:MAG: phospholipase A [Desulfobacterales bacterium]|nr:phospholipase A [Desulfobacterales bacterium]
MDSRANQEGNVRHSGPFQSNMPARSGLNRKSEAHPLRLAAGRFKYAVALMILLQSMTLFAGQPEPVVVVSPATHPAGGILTFTVYWHNPGDNPIRVAPQGELVCRLDWDGGAVEVTARPVQPVPGKPLTLAKGEFARMNYALTIPATVAGTVKMKVLSLGGASVLLAVGAPPAAPVKAAGTETDPAARQYADLDAFFSLYQPYLGNISGYEPMYFLVGTDPKKSRFQLSLKYRLFDSKGPLIARHPWLRQIHFAYTQTSFWDLRSASLPFEDTSYKPEIFFRTSNLNTGFGRIKGFYLQTGFQHESNGRGGENSRSTNTLYAKPLFIFYDEDTKFGLQIAPKVWAYVANEEEGNADLADYRGYFDLELKAGKADSLVLGSNLRWGAQGGSIQVDLTYPLRQQLSGNIDLYLQAQYVNSLAESLIDYKLRSQAFRLGFSIVR